MPSRIQGLFKRFQLQPVPISSTPMRGHLKGENPVVFFQGGGQGDDDSVDARRRRQGMGEGPESQPRAEAPRRRRGTEGERERPQTTFGGSGGSGGSQTPSFGGSGGSPLGGLKLPLWLIILLLVIFVAFFFFSSSGEEPSAPFAPQNPPATELPQASTPFSQGPTALPRATFTPVAFTPPAASTGNTWLVMLYQDADDQVLEQDIYTDLNEAERVGSTNQLHIVTQIDRFRGGFRGDGDWTSARRYYVKKDNDLNRLNSQLLGELGEVNMADSATLVDFVTWAVKTFPANHYVLILSDHGMGWPGGFTDGDNGGRDRSRVPIASAMGDSIFMMELDSALGEIRSKTGIDKFDMIGMDACLMSHIEVFSALAPYARYTVTSQETEPALGWAYTSFLKSLAAKPDMSASELGKLIVQSYIQDDQRIVDDQARADFASQGSPLGALFGQVSVPSANQLTSQMSEGITLTAADLSAMPALTRALNDFANALQAENQNLVAQARTYAQSFTSIWGSNVPPSYIDLGNFVQLVKRESSNKNVTAAADGVLSALKQVVIAEKHGRGKPGATGISIYFPNSQLYRNNVAGAESYTAVAARFAQESLWDDFMAYHYTRKPFEPSARKAVIPDLGAAVRGPGLGQIEVSPITASANTAAPRQPVRLSTQIKGTNIGYIFLFVGLYDQASNSIYVADTDYLESPTTREVGGVFYPVWASGQSFTMNLEWEPTVFSLTDGKKTVTALFNPERFGASKTETIYSVDGIYTFTADKQSRPARLYFQNGLLRSVATFTEGGQSGAAREIVPQAGDTFTLTEKWLDLDASGKVTGSSTEEGEVLTFGTQPFKWVEQFAAAGEYVVGFIVEDLDGNSQQVYKRITVR